MAGRRWLSLYLQHPEVICEHTRSFQAPALAEQPVPCLRSCPAARPPAGRQHNGRLVPHRWRQPQPKTQPGAAPAHCAKTSGLLARLPRCPGGRRWRTMGICAPNELPQRHPAAGAGPARHTGPSPSAVWSPKSGGRGGEGLCPAPHKPGRRNGVWPGVSWHGDVNTRTHAAPSGAALERCPVRCHALSVCLPVSFPLSQGQCGEEERYPPQLGAHPWLLSTAPGQRLRCPPLPGTWGCRHPNLLSGRWAMPPTPPEWEGSQQGQTGRVRVQGTGSRCCPIPSVGTFRWHTLSLNWPQGSGGVLSFSPTPHTGLSGPGRCPSPAHLAAELMGEEQWQSPSSATFQLTVLLGTRAAPWGAQAGQTSPHGAI